MEHNAPKSFVTWGPRAKRVLSRGGWFKLNPINDNFTSEFYWTYSCCRENGKYDCAYWNNISPRITSPSFDTEAEAIAWLENSILEMTSLKIEEANKSLALQMEKNAFYLQVLKKSLLPSNDDA